MDQQTALRQARHWLETDAAFGVTEAPLSRDVLGRATAPAAPEGRSVPSAGRPPHLATGLARGAGYERMTIPQSKAAPRTAPTTIIPTASALPPIPPGDIASLPALNREEKPALLEALRLQAETALGQYLNAIATKVVFGEGDANAALMFVGEGPGAEEDRTGRPFVGRSGQLLDKMIQAMGLKRQQVYIGNVVKLRAADPDPQTGRLKDRPPTLSEAALGIPWLHRQIELIRPQVLVTLGASAIRHLIGETENMTRVRGQWRNYRGLPVMPTYHPSFLLRAYTPENRGKVWSDLQQVMAKIRETG